MTEEKKESTDYDLIIKKLNDTDASSDEKTKVFDQICSIIVDLFLDLEAKGMEINYELDNGNEKLFQTLVTYHHILTKCDLEDVQVLEQICSCSSILGECCFNQDDICGAEKYLRLAEKYRDRLLVLKPEIVDFFSVFRVCFKLSQIYDSKCDRDSKITYINKSLKVAYDHKEVYEKTHDYLKEMLYELYRIYKKKVKKKRPIKPEKNL